MRRDGKYILIILAVWFLFAVGFNFLRRQTRPVSGQNISQGGGKKKTAIFQICPLDRAYADFNLQYFLGRLPKKANVLWADLTANNDMGLAWIDESGTVQIRIDRKMNPVERQADMTLLHEQCHIKLVGKELSDLHGIEFQRCMVDLAERGAFHDLW